VHGREEPPAISLDPNSCEPQTSAKTAPWRGFPGLRSRLGASGFHCEPADEHRCVAEDSDSNIFIFVRFPMKRTCFDQCSEWFEVFGKPCRFILNLTAHVSLQVVVRYEARNSLGISRKTRLPELSHRIAQLGLGRGFRFRAWVPLTLSMEA
jgi:hypothetical protein